ncbi:xanthine dehydrogenase family protein molybdopterin-binding subunit [Actinomadura rupiterrae]|uniref:xanthine dehydrogenase family protein molybdopterin-binding subunit n=1 Tax=Actinomadura rupiterrae TaxID=559627 RepID=UPI0020A5A635|nr:xanthine dehydrogenase family protein molybdopterin-binding subunit [Actinomadura rupiterrae]MCP2341502.1 xanthine dehydrogenase YagR molybdenum-binding subunit [Actinomadura rupiterrae]
MTTLDTPDQPSPPSPDGPLRPDGPDKLTGAARYTADVTVPGMLNAALVPATIPVGRVAAVDVSAAVRAPGVHAVLTAADMPDLQPLPSPPLGHGSLPMRDDVIRHEGQPVALVLADSWEQARYAAGLVGVEYADTAAPLAFEDAPDETPASGHAFWPTDASVGDVEAGLRAADVVVTSDYGTADRHANPIEPSATLAVWDESGSLLVHSSVQALRLTHMTLAGMFRLPPEKVRVICPYVGGGFGAKGYIWSHTILAAAAALVVRRPVKIVLTRAQMFTLSGHQPVNRQTVTLAATRDGALTAIRHHSTHPTAREDGYVEGATRSTGWLYACPAIETRMRVRRVDRPNPTAMRSPGEGIGLFALETAMDELAAELGMDPVELRIRNEPEHEPMTGLPFSTRTLVRCLREGARRFGWERRSAEPRSMRDGHDLIGWGVAAASKDSIGALSSARISMEADGRVCVETAIQEIGTGMPAAIQAVAGPVLGVAAETVRVRHGDTLLPAASPSIGSMSALSVGSAVELAATRLRDELEAAGGLEGLRAAGLERLEAEATWDPAEHMREKLSRNAYGAVFAEVRVDADLGQVRMSRCVGVFGAGRILSPVTARSQMIGGIAWGCGQALLERSVLDTRRGRFRSKNLSGYLVPVNADIGDVDVSFVEDDDRRVSAVGAKGIGELGAIGVAAAIANAVSHATGRRMRELPIRIEHLL